MSRPTRTAPLASRLSASRLVVAVAVGALLLGLPVAAGWLPGPAAPTNPKPAVDVVTAAAAEVQSIIKDEGIDRAAKRTRMETLLWDIVDMEYMSQLVMARNWRKFDADQQAGFTQEFGRHLVLTYFNNVVNAKIDRITLDAPRVDDKYGHVSIMTNVLLANDGPPVLIEYRLHEAAGGDWKIIDLSVESVKLVSNFRSQFKQTFSNGGADRLITLLREKNDALDAREAARS